MTVKTFSSREFNQATSRAQKAAKEGPVYVTDRGRPAQVLLSFEDYQKLLGAQKSIIDLLGEPVGIEDAELEIPSRRDVAKPADLL